MAPTVRGIVAASMAGLALTLGACGEKRSADAPSKTPPGAMADAGPPNLLLPDNFRGVCSGATVSAATAYDPGAKAHKALYFVTHKDDFTDQSASLPQDWTVLFSPDRDALKAVDLVVCARRTAEREVRVCEGFKKDGKPTQNKVRWHTATYELSVRDAKTGKTLAQKTVEATNADCPMLAFFNGDADTIDDYASLPSTVVADFLRPHMVR